MVVMLLHYKYAAGLLCQPGKYTDALYPHTGKHALYPHTGKHAIMHYTLIQVNMLLCIIPSYR